MGKKYLQIFFYLILCSVNMFAQNISALLTVNPYPSPYISDWENNPASLGSLTISNFDQLSFLIRIRTSVSRAGTGEIVKTLTNPIQLNAVPVQIITNIQFISFADANFTNNDYKQKVLFTGRLLEGLYTACFSIENIDGQVLASNICANFTIVYPSAPQLLFPMNNDSLAADINYPTFQWTPVIAPPAYQLTYSLKIVEILMGQSPLHAINSNVPVYENPQLNINSHTYPISAFPLENGKKYAWQVQVLDQYGFPPTQNAGKSEIFIFAKKKQSFLFFLLANVLLSAPSNNSLINTKKPEFKWLYTPAQGVSIKYILKLARVSENQTNEQAINNLLLLNQTLSANSNSFTPTSDLSFINNVDYVWQVTVINANSNAIINKSAVWRFKYKVTTQIVIGGLGNLPAWSSLSGTLHYKYSGPGETEHWPLPFKTVKLVVKYVMHVKSTSSGVKAGGSAVENPPVEIVLPFSEAVTLKNDADKVLDVKTTDANGNFKFSFVNPDSMGLFKKNHSFGGGIIYYGDVYRTARILVDDKYYLSPDDDIYIQPYENKTIGTLYSLLRSYTFEVTIKPSPDEKYSEQYTHQALNEMDVYILRKLRPYNLPSHEGSPKPVPAKNKFNYEVIAKGKTGQNGKFTFKRLILNLNASDTYYFFTESNVNATHTYKVALGSFKFDYTVGTGGNQYASGYAGTIEHKDPYKNYGNVLIGVNDYSVFNDEYDYPMVTRNFYALPLLPEIIGRVVRSDESGKGVDGAAVKLFNVTKVPMEVELEKKTSPNGDFEFKYLNVQFNPNPPFEINGPKRMLVIQAGGFKWKFQNIKGKGANGALTMGQRIYLGSIDLDPSAKVHGFIADEDGNGINAKIKIGDSPEYTVNTKGMFYDLNAGKFVIIPGGFEFPVAKLNNQMMIVRPVSNQSSYIIDTTYINIDQNYKDLGTIKIYRKLHRMRFFVLEETPGKPVYQWPKIPNAKVKVQTLGTYLEKTTNQIGQTNFEFSSDATEFKIIVEAPEGKYYEKRVGIVFNPLAKDEQFYTFSLKKATFISGNVYVANNKPVIGADVWVDFGNPDKNIFTKTDGSGEYLLKHVPINTTVRVFASKNSKDSTVIGDSIHVFTGKLGLGVTGKNLYLTIYNGMDITKLLGFPVLLTDLIEENNQIKISGVLKEFAKNELFSVFDSSSAKLKFHDVPIKPSSQLNSNGVPYAELSTLPLIMDDPEIDLKLYNKFQTKVGDVNAGVILDEYKSGFGTIKGKSFVSSSSFNTQGSIADYDGLNLSLPNVYQDKMLIPTITADGNKPVDLSSGFNVVNSNSGGLNFKINSFNAEADPNQSFFNYDTVRLRTTLHTNIHNAAPSDLNLNIGDVVFHQVGIDPIVGDKEFSFTLDKWKLESKKWYFNKGYLTISEGTLKTGADIPIKSLAITPSTFLSPSFDFTSLMVSGIVPLTIVGNIAFDFNSYQKYWYVSVSKKLGQNYSAYLKNLPGMQSNALMKISNFEINSKESFFTLTPVYGQKLFLYNVGILELGAAGALMAYDDYLYIPGLSFDIPKVTQSTGVEYYKGSDNKIAFRIKGININTNAGNGVYLKFGVNEEQQNSQVLDEDGFRSFGVVGEDGKFELKCSLFHTVDSTSILVETPNTPFTSLNQFQTLKIGNAKTYLERVTGGMKVASKQWKNFHFEGNLAGTQGVEDENKRLSFTVYGEIKADNQKISLKNVDTPFGGMSWTYEFENSRLIGSMDIHQDLGGIKIDGTSEMLIDGSGWYFLGGGTMQVPGIGPGYAAVLFGDYPTMTASVKQKFAASSYKKNLPNSFQKNISGFLFSGAMSVPVIVPHIGFDLKIVSVEFGVDAGGDIKIYKGFDEGGSTYGLSALAFIHAFLNMDAITCTDLSADAVVELGFEGSYQTGSGTFNLDGCGGFGLHAHLTQKLWGCDLDGCGCTGTVFDEGFDFSLKALMHLDNGGSKSFTFAKGTCSGN